MCDAPAFAVEEVDPTGAGDTFGAAYVTFWLRGLPPREALTLANAAGALAVGPKGPMEGTSTQAELDAFLNRQTSKELRMSRDVLARPAAAPRRAATASGSPRSAPPIRSSSRPPCARAGTTAAPVLIEATCNQVNQQGGYTGMTPADFRGFVEGDRRQGRLRRASA